MRPFGLTKELSKSFSKPVMEYLPDFFDAQEVYDSEYEDLESLAQLASPEIVNERLKRLGVSLSPDDLKERVLYNDGVRVAVSGLRYKNLDLGFPFVALKLNFRPDHDGVIQTLKKLVRETYAQSAPRGLTLLEKPDQDLEQSAIWNSVVAGPMEIGTALELPSGFEIRFEKSFTDRHDTYLKAYETWRSNNPQLAAFISPESREDLEVAASKGLLASLFNGNVWCGLVAAESSPLFGKKGLYLIEVFVDSRQQGQGLGLKLQSQFVSQLKDQFELVWGHIHAENKAAHITALRLGRKVIQQEYFFSLDV